MEVLTEKSKILTERLAFKPCEYQWAYDYWFQQQNAHWMFQDRLLIIGDPVPGLIGIQLLIILET